MEASSSCFAGFSHRHGSRSLACMRVCLVWSVRGNRGLRRFDNRAGLLHASLGGYAHRINREGKLQRKVRSRSRRFFRTAAAERTATLAFSRSQFVPRVTLRNCFAPALLHPSTRELLDPVKDPSKNLTPPCASPTVGANYRGIVTADVLCVRMT